MIGSSVLFTSRKGIVSRLIQFFTQSNYSHVGILFNIIEKEGIKYLIIIESRILSGVVANVYKYDKDKYHIYVHNKINEIKAIKITNEALLSIGSGYDFKAVCYRLFLILTFRKRKPNLWNEKSKFYCSELVAYLYDKNDLYFSTKIQFNNITPCDIEESKFTKIIYDIENFKGDK